MTKGLVIGGEFSRILVRQKSGCPLEMGELLVTDNRDQKILLQVYDMVYGSQISQINLELISGMQLEESTDVSFMDPTLRNYTLAVIKPLITLQGRDARLCKQLPHFFSDVRSLVDGDIRFLTMPSDPLFVGALRSGGNVLDTKIHLPGKKVFQHHILIPATTGRGKSNLVKVMLWHAASQDYCGILVLDPHDEYFGRNDIGLKDHPSHPAAYYTVNNPPPGATSLKLNLKLLKPEHFRGVMNLSDPQRQAMYAYYTEYGNRWLESIILSKPLHVEFHEMTIAVLKRRFLAMMDLKFDGNQLHCRGVFDIAAGESAINDVADLLEKGRIVIIDTSSLPGQIELLIGSLFSTEIFNRYKRYKMRDLLKDKPVVSVVLEEAPRVIGKDALQQGSNIFSTIAREGRKFNVGLMAITQLPSLIPRDILANMNTKIVLGMEMAPERQAIIDSASQDLSMDNRNIASLDKGEAIVTSNFTRFATPVKIPLFEDIVKDETTKPLNSFSGVQLN